jgi:hypothetical protein
LIDFCDEYLFSYGIQSVNKTKNKKLKKGERDNWEKTTRIEDGTE